MKGFGSIKLSFPDKDKFKYSVRTTSDGKKMVTCVVKYTAYVNYQLYDLIKIMASQKEIKYLSEMADRKPCIAVGKAVLNGNDEFDLEKGKKIARTKAENAAYRYMVKRYTRLMKEVTKRLADTVIAFSNKGCGLICHNEAYIRKLTDDKQNN